MRMALLRPRRHLAEVVMSFDTPPAHDRLVAVLMAYALLYGVSLDPATLRFSVG